MAEGYWRISDLPVERTIDLGSGVLVDVDQFDRIVGVESIGHEVINGQSMLADLSRVLKSASFPRPRNEDPS